MSVAGEHVQGRGGRCEYNCITGGRQLGSFDYHCGHDGIRVGTRRQPDGESRVAAVFAHHCIVPRHHVHHGNIGRVSRERVLDHTSVTPEKDSAGESRADFAHQLVDAGSLEQTACNPDDAIVRE